MTLHTVDSHHLRGGSFPHTYVTFSYSVYAKKFHLLNYETISIVIYWFIQFSNSKHVKELDSTNNFKSQYNIKKHKELNHGQNIYAK